MTTLLLLIGLTLTACAVALIARGFITARLRATETLGSIGHYGYGSDASAPLPPHPS